MAKATERQKELRRIRYRENIDVERERSRAYYLVLIITQIKNEF